MKLEILNIEGKKTGEQIDLPADIFGIEPNDHAIYLSVKQYHANQRQGTHAAKEKSQLSGSTRKLHKQKGTGGSRKGSIKNPLFRGGARIFGPRPKNYEFKLNKKVKTLAINSVFSHKAKDNSIIVLEDFTFKAPKTKDYAKMLTNLKVADKKSLLLTAEKDNNVQISARNIPYVKTSVIDRININDILDAQCLLMTVSSLNRLSGGEKKEKVVKVKATKKAAKAAVTKPKKTKKQA